MRDPYRVIIRPIFSEKSNTLRVDSGQYVFEVNRDANKREIGHAVEVIFSRRKPINVRRVNTILVKGKTKRFGRFLVKTRSWKKAIVSLEPNQQIEDFEAI